MTDSSQAFVLQSPGGLSERAVDFLRRASRRVPFDRGLTGDSLRGEIERVYGRSDEDFVRLLEHVQERYGGLAYRSGFFQAEVEFLPVCESEDANEELEILYAVETGGPAGASVKPDGRVEVGIDSAGVVEFPHLDGLIECDAMFDAAGRLPVENRFNLSLPGVAQAVSRLSDQAGDEIRPVTEASGGCSHWFEGPSLAVFVCGTWSELGMVMPPFVRVWADSAPRSERWCRAIGACDLVRD